MLECLWESLCSRTSLISCMSWHSIKLTNSCFERKTMKPTSTGQQKTQKNFSAARCEPLCIVFNIFSQYSPPPWRKENTPGRNHGYQRIGIKRSPSRSFCLFCTGAMPRGRPVCKPHVARTPTSSRSSGTLLEEVIPPARPLWKDRWQTLLTRRLSECSFLSHTPSRFPCYQLWNVAVKHDVEWMWNCQLPTVTLNHRQSGHSHRSSHLCKPATSRRGLTRT